MVGRKSFALIISFVVIIGGFFWLGNFKSLSSTQPLSTVAVSNWSSGIGAVSDTNFDKQKLSFSATVWNNTNHSVYVTSVKVNLTSALQNHILSGDTLISVNKSLAPNESYNVTGQFRRYCRPK
jgi:hypothetical protein